MASNLRVDTILPSTGTSLGIGTASGTTTVTGNLVASSASVTGNLGVGGTLTYEDVTNIDSVGVVTARTDINLGDSIIHIGDTNTKIRFPAADTITAETGGAERFRINSQGKVLVNTTTASSVGNSQYSNLEVSGNTSGATGPGHLSIKRGTATASLSNGDTIGRLIFSSLDGGDFAYIQASVDAAPGSSDYPGRMMFHTCADGANTATERLRIGSAGQIGLGGANYGTSGQVLTSAGSGSAVQWGSIYNERYTVSNITGTSQINVTNLGTDPHEICINFHLLKGAGDPCAILLRLGTSSGLYSSMTYNQTWTYFNNTSSTTLNNSRNHDQNAFWIYNNNFTSPLNIYSGNITLRRTITGTYLLAGSAMSDRNENNNQYSNFTNGRVDISGACTQLRIYVDNGTNFAQGSVTVRTIA